LSSKEKGKDRMIAALEDEWEAIPRQRDEDRIQDEGFEELLSHVGLAARVVDEVEKDDEEDIGVAVAARVEAGDEQNEREDSSGEGEGWAVRVVLPSEEAAGEERGDVGAENVVDEGMDAEDVGALAQGGDGGGEGRMAVGADLHTSG
jgi:hypothetical protein